MPVSIVQNRSFQISVVFSFSMVFVFTFYQLILLRCTFSEVYCEIWHLQLNPVELIFARIKNILRARLPYGSLNEDLIDELAKISHKDILKIYKHCGFC